MKIALWIVQALLALAFFGAGAMKTLTPAEELAAAMPWIADMGATGVLMARVAGVSELLGAIGLILPSATRILPKLTPIAAAALALVMVLASALHLSRGEFAALPPNFVLFALAAFVAYGRTKLHPIAPRGDEATAAPA